MTCPASVALLGEDGLVADKAVVRDMGIGEKKVLVADDGFFASAGAAMNGGKFAEGIALADLEMRGLAPVFQVLGLEPDGGVGEKFVAGTDFARAVESGVNGQRGSPHPVSTPAPMMA